jgi:hypothetical protein
MACIQQLKYTCVIHNRFDLPITFPLALEAYTRKGQLGFRHCTSYIFGELFTTPNSLYKVRVDHLFTASFTSTALLNMVPTETVLFLYSHDTFS